MGHTIQETTVTDFIGNYIRRVIVIKGSIYSQVYGTNILTSSLGQNNWSKIDVGKS